MRVSRDSTDEVSLYWLPLTRSYVFLLLRESTAPAVLLSWPSTRPATPATTPVQPKPFLPRGHTPIYVVLPRPRDVVRGEERGVSPGVRPEAGVLENVPVLVDVRLLRPLQLVGPWRRRLQESADVERGPRAEKGGRRRRFAGPIPVGVGVVWAVDIVLAGTGDDR